MSAFTIDAPTDEDGPAIAGLMRARHAEFGIGPAHIDEDLTLYRTYPGVDRAVHQRVARLDGGVVGVATAWPDDERLSMIGYVEPEARASGIGSALLTWFHATGRDGGATTLVSEFPGSDAIWQAMLTDAGFSIVRSVTAMEHPDPATLRPTPIPAGITVTEDLRGEAMRAAMVEAFEGAFADHWDHRPAEYRRIVAARTAREDFDPSLVTIAHAADGSVAGYVVGACSSEGHDIVGEVTDIGVLPAFRGAGLGTALLHLAVAALAARGVGRVLLEVDADDPSGALSLYERAGFQEAATTLVAHRPITR